MCNFSHGTIRTRECELFAVVAIITNLSNVNVGTRVAGHTKITERQFGKYICKLSFLRLTIMLRFCLTARAIIVKQWTVQNNEEQEQVCKSFVSHEEQCWTDADLPSGRCNPFGLVDATHTNWNEAEVGRAAWINLTITSVTRMSSILMHFYFFVRQMCNIIVIDVLFLIVLVRVDQLPELIWILNLRSNVSFDFLLFDFS